MIRCYWVLNKTVRNIANKLIFNKLTFPSKNYLIDWIKIIECLHFKYNLNFDII